MLDGRKIHISPHSLILAILMLVPLSCDVSVYDNLFAPPVHGPTVTGITPNTGLEPNTVSITDLAGTDFKYDATVMLTRAGFPEIPASEVTVVSDTRITCSINLTGAMHGLWNVMVTNPDTRYGTLPNGFTVTWSAFTATYDGNGSTAGAVPIDANPYYQGDMVTVQDNTGALERTGYVFNGWNTAADGSGTGYNPGTTFFMGTSSVTLYAQWTINQYTLIYTAGANGTITGTTPQTVNYSANGSAVTAVPDTGYYFIQWSDGSTANPRTDTLVAGDITVTAAFAVNQYTLTYAAGANGSISGTSPQTVNHGSDGTSVTAVPDTGYYFIQWSDGVLTASRTDINITANISVTASFAINQYTLTYTAGANGSISGTSPQTVNHGSDGTSVTAVPDTGYYFIQWSDGVLTASRTDTNVTGNISVNAAFAINQYTLTYTSGANGSITGTTPQTVNHGASGTAVTAVPDAGYHFVQWSDGSTTNPRTDINVTGNISVSASFAGNQYTVTFNPGDGTTPVPATMLVSYGSTYGSLAATTRFGYQFAGWWTGLGGTGTEITAVSIVTTALDHILYAKWEHPVFAFVSDRDGNSQIYLMNIDGSVQTNISNNVFNDYDPAWSPDGTRIAFSSDRDGNREIYVTNVDGTDQTNLSNNGSYDAEPSWSPDGTKIAFYSNRIEGDNIFVMNADGSGQTRISTVANNGSPAWSPDGTRIAFHSHRAGPDEIWIINPDGTNEIKFVDDGFRACWSSDGAQIAFQSITGSNDIYSIITDGSGKLNLTDNPAVSDKEPSWSPDGTKIVFESNRDGNSEIYVMNANGSSQTRITVGSSNNASPDWFRYPTAVVTSITPNSWPRNGTVSITNLAGFNFKSGATVRLTKAGQADIIGNGITVVSATRITCSFNLTNAANGLWNIAVTNPDGMSGTLKFGFNVFMPFVAVGPNNSIITADGITWTNEITGGMTDFRRIAYGNGVFVAVGQSNYRIRTRDGINWTDAATGGGCLMGIAYGNGVFVSVGSGGTRIRSTDYGLTWQDETIGGQDLWRVAYGNEVFVSAGNNRRIIRSIDYGITWIDDISNGAGTFYGIAFGNGVFVAVDINGMRIRSLDNGVTWIDQSFGSIMHYGLAYGKGVFVAVGDGGRIARSTDYGITWTEQTLGGNWLRGITYGNGKFIAVGDGGTRFISPDGFNWTDVSGGSGLYAIAGGLGNLLTNPGYETGNETGWTLTPNEPLEEAQSLIGNSWALADLADSMIYGQFDPAPRTGIYSLVASYNWCTKKQTIDIYNFGLSSADLSGIGVKIIFSEFVRNNYYQPDRYYSKITIIADDGVTTLASIDNGTQASPITISTYPNWSEQAVIFTNSSGFANIRYFEVESGGKDTRGWSGHYGTQFDDASLTIDY